MGARTQQVKGKANEAVGKTKDKVGFRTRNNKMEAKGEAQTLKGKAQKAMGKVRSKAKK